MQIGQIVSNGLPNDTQIDREVTVRQSVSHLVSSSQGQLWMGFHKFREVALNVAACLTDHLEIADYGVLRHLFFKEGDFIEILGLVLNTFNRL